ncbi:unnamed protein product [Acanthoscelides obtectus]|uniref:Uncharacterized protein n=1 Tax=Acanthoscelides obtectus TaxID=200917 RepID=A0A9P0PSH8_ACAOB|nr:unnamed protein product [Acanthoscelides obtectus]CAK1646484.1 hypothetical protein AOBTE_LOCUS14655 [Acanthoscelides obtectus]
MRYHSVLLKWSKQINIASSKDAITRSKNIIAYNPVMGSSETGNDKINNLATESSVMFVEGV